MDGLADDVWRRLLLRRPADAVLSNLYGPLIAARRGADGCYVLGRIAQSLDGYIATDSGASRWISGREDVVHTHRLRALFDAVVVGAATIRADNPQLTTRAVTGTSPVRVVIDADQRLQADRRVFQEPPETLLICAEDAAGPDRCGLAEVVRVPRDTSGLAIGSILSALAVRGLTRIFVEGGGVTVSRFLAARALDRLHVTIAPTLLGSGIPSFSLPGAATPDAGLQLRWMVHCIGNDILLDIPLSRSTSARCQ
jgi:riboflavin-specific deaminase-like protein